MSNRSKQGIPLLSSKYLNDINDATVGGALSAVPSGVTATQGAALQLGDYIDLTESDALALSDTAVGTLSDGRYQYVTLDASATTLALGQMLFWKQGSESTYTVTNVESGNIANAAGVLVNPSATKGNAIFMQCAGRATVLFRATLTAAGAKGVSIFAAAAGAGADNATADVLATNVTYNPIFQSRFIGTAETTPTNATASLVDLRGLSLRY